MTVTLTIPELAMLQSLLHDGETPEDALHRLLLPMVQRHAEARLQILADMYRALSPEDQIEAVELLKVWQQAKQIPE